MLTGADRSIWDCECGHDSSGQHNGLGCYGRVSYEPLVKCGCKRTDADHEDTVERNVAARAARAWDEGWEAAWSPLSMHSLNAGPNPYRSA